MIQTDKYTAVETDATKQPEVYQEPLGDVPGDVLLQRDDASLGSTECADHNKFETVTSTHQEHTIQTISSEDEIQDKTIKNEEYFKSTMMDLQKIHPDLVQAAAYDIKVSSSGKGQILCKPCSTKTQKWISVDTKEKCLSNYKLHIKTSRHRTLISTWSSTQTAKQSNTRKDTEKEFHVKIASQMEKVHEAFPKKFTLIKTGFALQSKIRCDCCNSLLSLFPERGDVVKNAANHMMSHPNSSTEKCQTSISKFFKVDERKEKPE